MSKQHLRPKSTRFRKISTYIQKYPTLYVFIYRFIPGVRFVSPCIIGMVSARYWPFLVIDLFAALLWGTVLAGVGYLFGTASMRMIDEFSAYAVDEWLRRNYPSIQFARYADNDARFQNAEFTSVIVIYYDGTVEAATKKLKLPLRVFARQSESVSSVNGGRVVKCKESIISGTIPEVVTRTKPLTLQMEGHFTKHDGSKLPFAIDEHFDVEIENATKSAAEVLQDR